MSDQETFELSTGADRLQNLSFFRNLDFEETLALAEIVERQEYRDGDTIIEEGAIGSHLYIVESGEVEVWRESEKGQLRIGRLKAGEHFGEMSLLSGELTTAAVVAKGICEVLTIEQGAFNELLEENDRLAARVYRAFCLLMAERLKSMTDELVNISNR